MYQQAHCELREKGFARWRVILLRLGLCVLVLLQGSLSVQGSGHDNDYDDDDLGESIGVGIVGGILAAFVGTAPWWAPPAVINDNPDLDGRFPAHPYDDDHGGFLLLDNDYSLHETAVGNLFARASADVGSNFDGIERLGVNLHLETRKRWGFDIDWATFDVEPGSTAAGNFDTGDANFIYRFAQSEHAQWWTGVGVNWLNEEATGEHFGLNFTYGADICIGNPWVASFQFDAGANAADPYFRGRGTIGLQWQAFELFTGYDYIDAGKNDAGTVVAGLRIWF